MCFALSAEHAKPDDKLQGFFSELVTSIARTIESGSFGLERMRTRFIGKLTKMITAFGQLPGKKTALKVRHD